MILKHYSSNAYEGVYSQFGLDKARRDLAELKDYQPNGDIDERRKGEYIEMLKEVISKREEAIAALIARQEQKSADGAKQIADAADERKRVALAKLRPFFPGTDAEFETQADQLYADHQREEMQRNVAKAKANIRF